LIVLDSSAAVDYLTQREPGGWVAGQIDADPNLYAPHLFDVEVLSGLRRLVRERIVSRTRARSALDDLLDLDISRYPHAPLLKRMWQLRETVTAADAAFLALAEALAATLVTTDARLARASGLRVRVVSP
jgi:predicted nucleic acid-binding protein